MPLTLWLCETNAYSFDYRRFFDHWDWTMRRLKALSNRIKYQFRVSSVILMPLKALSVKTVPPSLAFFSYVYVWLHQNDRGSVLKRILISFLRNEEEQAFVCQFSPRRRLAQWMSGKLCLSRWSCGGSNDQSLIFRHFSDFDIRRKIITPFETLVKEHVGEMGDDRESDDSVEGNRVSG